ncbi:MAG: hypothetical protein IJW47_00800, partial [Clostridia bacterium]|nr:hypothetical protein [Clostridia bacterium]
MYRTLDSTEFISSVRVLDPILKNIKISSVEIDKNTREITYVFICDNTVGDELKEKILKQAELISPPVFSAVKIIVKKIVSNAELINTEIFRFITENYPSLSIFLKPTDVVTAEVGDVVKYVLKLTEDGVEYALRGGVIKKLNEFLSKRFCSEFAGSTQIKQADETVSLLSDEVYYEEVRKIEHRTIKVNDMVVVDDVTMDTVALYIEDATSGQVTICGKITDISERVAKNGKPFFIIHLDDTTGSLSGVYFSKKNTLTKIRELIVGDAIIARGSIGDYNGQRRFTFDKINRCTFPADFVKKENFKKPLPKEYKQIL